MKEENTDFRNISAPALLGDNTGKIATFAVFPVESSVNIDGDPNGLLWYLKNLSLPYAHTENSSTFIIYNPAFRDIIHIAVHYALKSFFFITNELPATITYYEGLNTETYKKSDVLENITVPGPAEEFILRHSGCDIKFKEEMILENSGSYCDSIINENYAYYISRAVDDSLIPRARAMARHNARRMEKPIKEI